MNTLIISSAIMFFVLVIDRALDQLQEVKRRKYQRIRINRFKRTFKSKEILLREWDRDLLRESNNIRKRLGIKEHDYLAKHRKLQVFSNKETSDFEKFVNEKSYLEQLVEDEINKDKRLSPKHELVVRDSLIFDPSSNNLLLTIEDVLNVI